MIKIESVDEALALLEEQVDKAGVDFTYRPPSGNARCFYHWEGEPSCIVGRILHKQGATIEELQRFDLSGTVLSLQVGGLLPDVSYEAAGVLRSAQAKQDNGYTWGEALPDARAAAPAYQAQEERNRARDLASV